MSDDKYHQPVLVTEVLAHLNKKRSVIDATLGTGGHSLKLLEEGHKVLGIELDPEILEIAQKRLGGYNCQLVNGNFKDIDKIAKNAGFEKPDAVLFDLGMSNLQLMDEKRGFSFSNPNADLDARINKDLQGVTGATLLNVLRKDQLEDMFKRVMDESSARWLAKRVMEKRELSPIRTVGDFIEITRGLKTKNNLNFATLPFLALRIAVNSEMKNLKEALPKAYDLLETGGKLLVISFHSTEENVVRAFSRDFEGPIRPSLEEIADNPKSRSAELFVLTKK